MPAGLPSASKGRSIGIPTMPHLFKSCPMKRGHGSTFHSTEIDMLENTNQPKVLVWVEDGVIKVDQHLLQIPVGRKDVPIKWVMKDSEWTFTSDGIVVDNDNGQFINFHST